MKPRLSLALILLSLAGCGKSAEDEYRDARALLRDEQAAYESMSKHHAELAANHKQVQQQVAAFQADVDGTGIHFAMTGKKKLATEKEGGLDLAEWIALEKERREIVERGEAAIKKQHARVMKAREIMEAAEQRR